MAFTTQRLSVAVQFSAAPAAQERAEALGLSVWRPTHERRPRWAARGMTLGPHGVGEHDAGTATGNAFVVHGFACLVCTLFGGLLGER